MFVHSVCACTVSSICACASLCLYTCDCMEVKLTACSDYPTFVKQTKQPEAKRRTFLRSGKRPLCWNGYGDTALTSGSGAMDPKMIIMRGPLSPGAIQTSANETWRRATEVEVSVQYWGRRANINIGSRQCREADCTMRITGGEASGGGGTSNKWAFRQINIYCSGNTENQKWTQNHKSSSNTTDNTHLARVTLYTFAIE